MKDYVCKDIEKWDEFCEIARNEFKINKNEKWIFRGHIPGKPLKSSLERAAEYYPGKLSKISTAEELLLRDFKRHYHQYSSDAPKDKDYLEWWSIMQHYGAPTRLLDFTYSIYIAAHFALKYTDGDRDYFEVFAVNARWAIKECIKKFRNDKKAKKYLWKLIDNTDEDLENFETYFKRSPKEFVCPFNPFRLAERLSLQHGVFMCPGNVNETFEYNLKSLVGWNMKSNIIKLRLKFKKKKDEIIKARANLHELNITSATLFPGLEGFAKSLTMHPPKFLGTIACCKS